MSCSTCTVLASIEGAGATCGAHGRKHGARFNAYSEGALGNPATQRIVASPTAEEQAIIDKRRKELADSKARQDAALRKVLTEMGLQAQKNEAAWRDHNARFGAVLASAAGLFAQAEIDLLRAKSRTMAVSDLSRLVDERRASLAVQIQVGHAMGIVPSEARTATSRYDHVVGQGVR